jgi:HD superfamily phosphohydrolase YqeK
MASPSHLPTKVVAGVTVPDTPLITKSLEYVRQYSTDDTYNHIVRSFLLGFIIADKVLPDRDREAHAVAAIMHDLGFPIGHPPHSEIITQDKRFEVDGANAARNFLKKEAGEGWDKYRLQLVWDAIALHTIGSIVFEKEPEVQACSYGIWADFQGPDRVQGGLLSWEEYNAVTKVCSPSDESQRKCVLIFRACADRTILDSD